MATTPTFQAVGTVVAQSGGTANVVLPSCNDGDHLVIAYGGRGGAPTPPAGWTTYGIDNGAGSYFALAYLFHKVAVAADSGATVAITGLSGTGWGVGLVYSPARRNRPVAASGNGGSGAGVEVTSYGLTGISSIEGNTVNVTVFCSTDDTAPEDQTVTNSYGTSRASQASSAAAAGFRVVEDTSAISATRTATSATSGLMAAQMVSLAGTGGQMGWY